MSRLHAAVPWIVIAALGAFGCGGSQPPAEEPREGLASSEAEPQSLSAEMDLPETVEKDKEPEGAPDAGGSERKEGAPEPKFTEAMSVDAAIDAVPQGTPRINLDPDALGEPLQDAKLYEPCKVGGRHFKLRVAVWDGKAVGVDVKTGDKKLAECIDREVRGVAWKDKVKSLNTIEYSF